MDRGPGMCRVCTRSRCFLGHFSTLFIGPVRATLREKVEDPSRRHGPLGREFRTARPSRCCYFIRPPSFGPTVGLRTRAVDASRVWGATAATIATNPRRIASGRFGQASISRARVGSWFTASASLVQAAVQAAGCGDVSSLLVDGSDGLVSCLHRGCRGFESLIAHFWNPIGCRHLGPDSHLASHRNSFLHTLRDE